MYKLHAEVKFKEDTIVYKKGHRVGRIALTEDFILNNNELKVFQDDEGTLKMRPLIVNINDIELSEKEINKRKRLKKSMSII